MGVLFRTPVEPKGIVMAKKKTAAKKFPPKKKAPRKKAVRKPPKAKASKTTISPSLSSPEKEPDEGSFTKDEHGRLQRQKKVNKRGRPKGVSPTPRKGGKPSLKLQAASRASSDHSKKEWTDSLRDIANLPPHETKRPFSFDTINWERRKACKADPLLDLQTYFPKIFYLGWADYQRSLISNIEDRVRFGGKKAFGCPRGGGKTAICRGMIIRATKYGLRNFAFFIGSKEPKAIQTLRSIKGLWYRSQELQEDFPEIAYPVYRVEGRSMAGSEGQTYKGERTHLKWAAGEVQYPCMLFDEEQVQGFLEHEPESLIWLPDAGISIPKFLIKSAGTIIRVAGVDGSIRGEAELHPFLLTQPRPDLVLLDDVQKDQRADSPKACEDLERLIESAVDYLAAPDISQTTLMPCTVIREDDVSDRYLTPIKKPEWTGERHGIIIKYPQGIDDDSISSDTEQGRLWLQYEQLREQSFLTHGDNRGGNKFYADNKEAMDAGFQVSWEGRYKSQSEDPNQNELSAIQAAMNWRFKDLASFHSEGQNRPRKIIDDMAITLTASQVAENVTYVGRNELTPQWRILTAFVDVQGEILFYGVLAVDHDMTGQFIDYGTWPSVNTRFFTKNQTYGWGLLSREYFKRYPEEKPIRKGGKLEAPLEPKIYYALSQLIPALLSRKFVCDANGNTTTIRGLAIDMKWSATTDVVKRFIREYNNEKVIGYQGHAYLPSYKQLEEYNDEWLYEHKQYPHVQESTWCIKNDTKGFRYVLADVNRLKTNLMKRLGSPQGSKGCITLFNASPDEHRMFAEHVAESEYPDPITARGFQKDCWKPKPGKERDNDFLDVAAGAYCMASICGASLKTKNEIIADQEVSKRKPKRRTLRDAYKNRKVRS